MFISRSSLQRTSCEMTSEINCLTFSRDCWTVSRGAGRPKFRISPLLKRLMGLLLRNSEIWEYRIARLGEG